MTTNTEYRSVLDHVDDVVSWQQVFEGCCSRCGVKYDRPLNRSKFDDRILLCDGCVFIDTVLFAPDVIKEGKEKTAHDFWDASEWVALQ